MDYVKWLIVVSLLFAVAERLRPVRRAQSPLRPQLLNDLFYLFFNGHFYSLLTAGAVGWVVLQTQEYWDQLSWLPTRGALGGQPFVLQLLVYLVISDFLQWLVHRMLHGVPFLWQFHKVHHSLQQMDWIGNFRFHWVELLVYRCLIHVPLMWLGGDPQPLLAAAVLGTAWGHFNHANLDLGLGPLAWVFNSPRMHLWHHDASSEGGAAKNFGIVLSLWDHLFGTAYWPRDRTPNRIGYPGDREMPSNLPQQLIFPLLRSADASNDRPSD